MAPTDKIDLCKLHKDQYATPKSPILLTIGEAMYLSICGRGAPGGPEFTEKIGALYGVAFTTKMTHKFAGLQDYAVCKLEAQWWMDDDSGNFANVAPDRWNWRMMFRTPSIVKQAEVEKAIDTVMKKGKTPHADQVKLESFTEGLCVQMLHLGPYDQEPVTVAVMKAFAEKQGLAFNGRHHEIYLSDPRRISPERLKTILRLPVGKK
jgi:hypothetical protein